MTQHKKQCHGQPSKQSSYNTSSKTEELILLDLLGRSVEYYTAVKGVLFVINSNITRGKATRHQLIAVLEILATSIRYHRHCSFSNYIFFFCEISQNVEIYPKYGIAIHLPCNYLKSKVKDELKQPFKKKKHELKQLN